MKKIVFTGGGSAGHVTPNLALISKLRERHWELHYIGSKDGIEKNIIKETNVPFYGISCGKLRRYFDLENFKDPFKVLAGIFQSYSLLRSLKPDVVFSKGGFVSVPVVIGAKLNNFPVFIHESDLTPGLANKIAVKFASKIFVTFEEAVKHFPSEKTLYTGSPIREEILNGSKRKGLRLLGFSNTKPIITVIGGSLGSVRLNTAVREILSKLLQDYQLVHICGKNNVDETLNGLVGYKQFEYLSEELPDVLAATDLVISRAGSNSIFEFLALKIPMLLVPLPKSASRGDQILNAESFQKKGFASILYDEDVNEETLYRSITDLYQNRKNYLNVMSLNAPAQNCLDEIIKFMEQV